MDGRFVTAFVLPEEWEILGYRVGPFTLRHYLTMLAIDSPILTGEVKDVRPEDVIIFLRICSMDNAFVALKEPTMADKWRQAKLEFNMNLMVRTVITIKEYVGTGLSAPKTFTKEDGVKQFKRENIPGVLGIATSLMARLNMDAEDAWRLTPGQAIWYLTAFAISEGAEIRILTTQEEAKAESEREFLLRKQKEALSFIKERMKNRGANR